MGNKKKRGNNRSQKRLKRKKEMVTNTKIVHKEAGILWKVSEIKKTVPFLIIRASALNSI